MQRFENHLRERFPEKRESMDGLEEQIHAWELRFRQITGETFPAADAAAHARKSGTALALIAIQAGNISARCVNLGNGIIRLVNGRSAHAAPAVTRALVETCCIPLYMDEELVPRLKRNRVNDVHKLLFRLGLGTNPSSTLYIKPIKVSSLIDAARRALVSATGDVGRELVDMYYDTLTEFTHPNFGAVTLSSQVTGGTMRWQLQPDFDEHWLWAAIDPAGFFMEVAGSALDEVLHVAKRFPMDLSGEPSWREEEIYPVSEQERADALESARASLRTQIRGD